MATGGMHLGNEIGERCRAGPLPIGLLRSGRCGIELKHGASRFRAEQFGDEPGEIGVPKRLGKPRHRDTGDLGDGQVTSDQHHRSCGDSERAAWISSTLFIPGIK